jgi:hypothetical protein
MDDSMNSLLRFCSLLAATGFIGFSAHAAESKSEHREFEPPPEKPLQPATRSSGSVPIDLTHGLILNNGTYGMPDPEHESWAKANLITPGLSEKRYPFDRKEEFVAGCNESMIFIDAALDNWKTRTSSTWPEAVEYAKKSSDTIAPLANKLRDAIALASHSGSGDWDRNQDAARTAVIEARSTYASLHRNIKH